MQKKSIIRVWFTPKDEVNLICNPNRLYRLIRFFLILFIIASGRIVGLGASADSPQNSNQNSKITLNLNSELLSQAIRYHKLNDYPSAIRIYEKVLANEKKFSADEISALNEVFDIGLWQDSLSAIQLVHYNLAHALYQQYLISLTQTASVPTGNGLKPTTDEQKESSAFLAQAIYHYLVIVNTPTFASSYSPLLVELSSNNLNAIRQRHSLGALTLELGTFDKLHQTLRSLVQNHWLGNTLPHLLGISFLMLIGLGVGLLSVNKFFPNFYPQSSLHQKNFKLRNILDVLNRLKKLLPGNPLKSNQVTIPAFYLDTADDTAVSTSPNISRSGDTVFGKSPTHDRSNHPGFKLINTTIKTLKLIVILDLVVYMAIALILFYVYSPFLINRITDIKNILISDSTALADQTSLAVVSLATPLRQNPAIGGSPLTTLAEGETVAVFWSASRNGENLTSPANPDWLRIKNANGITGWVTRKTLILIEKTN